MDYLSVYVEMLQAKNLTANTIKNYQTYIKVFLFYLEERHLTPDNISWDTVRTFLRWLQNERQLSDRTMNMVISHLQFFWSYVLHLPWDTTQVPFRKFNTFLPFVPDQEQVKLLLDSLNASNCGKAYLACSILYATGMRLDELCHLECRNISLSKKRIYIPISKNHSDRYVPIPESICSEIKRYWYSCPADMRPKKWLFTQQTNTEKPMDKQWLQRVIMKQKKKLALDSRFSVHSLRHSYATHSYESGMHLLTLKTYLGHKSINSTAIYIHLADPVSGRITNPFDQLGGSRHD